MRCEQSTAPSTESRLTWEIALCTTNREGTVIAGLIIAGAIMAPGVPAHAEQSVVHRRGCRTHSCRVRVRRKKYIKPYIGFLRSTGACESGTDGNLHHGLTVHNPGGQYHGRYQFGLPDWQRAGGPGDPHNAGWLTQAYYAVRWLKINGRGSWPNC